MSTVRIMVVVVTKEALNKSCMSNTYGHFTCMILCCEFSVRNISSIFLLLYLVSARNNMLSLIKMNCKYHNFIYFKQIAH